jgi:hypothetical protein
MRRRSNRSCTYAVSLDRGADSSDVQALAHYLSTLNHQCEVVVIDASDGSEFDDHRRVLRWVSRHVAIPAHHRYADGSADMIHAAVELSLTEKVIVARIDTRYSAAEVAAVCEMLDRFDVVEPEEYFDPLPWWGGLDAGRILLHRGVDQGPDDRATFGFRRAAFHPMRLDDRSVGNSARRFVMQGAALHEARGVFVRREPQQFATWLRLRPREATGDLVTPVKSAFFFAVLPMLLILAILGGAQVAAGYAGVMTFASVMLAIRGRAGAAKFFPLRACLFAPLWIVERSVSVYWALFDRLRGATRNAPATAVLRSSQSVASGE